MRPSSSFVLSMAVVVVISQLILAADPKKQQASLKRTAEAVQAEIDGNVSSRSKHLMDALSLEHSNPFAHWYSGHVETEDSSWITVDEAIDKAMADKVLAEYDLFRKYQAEARIAKFGSRNNLDVNIVSNIEWELNRNAAQWCLNWGLEEQCRAHLENMVLLCPDDQNTRELLGHVEIDHQWLTIEDQRDLFEKEEIYREGHVKFGQIIGKLKSQLNSHYKRIRESASEKLFAIKDPLAIPVVESMIEDNLDSSAVAIDWLGKSDHPMAAMVLARVAVSTKNDNLKKQAVEQLKLKSPYDYVPDLLNGMSSPLWFQTIPEMKSSGMFAGFRQILCKETMNEFRKLDEVFAEIHVDTPVIDHYSRFPTHQKLHNDYRKLSKPYAEIRFENQLTEMARRSAKILMASTQRNAVQENQQIQEANKRIAEVVSQTFDVEFKELPNDVWNWWDSYNRTDYQKDKAIRPKYNYSSYTIAHAVHFSVTTYGGLSNPTGPYKKKSSCFAAGTEVCTNRGLKRIESITTGELVLSRDVRTGELKFKPVVTQTNREASDTVIIKLANDSIHATCGHLLWVCGKGWTQAGEIKPGDLLHVAGEPAEVLSCELAGQHPTFNLIVADNHNYFVGHSRVLSHDVLPRGSVKERIPGEFCVLKR
ncbi:MAG: Hint domain-containing protein [Pirellulales bacterium]